ncbi:MAG: hypothetical protein ACU0DB_12825 [Paracoccus sp. (in: a-proteobacteria)]|jgi:hypothetical protein|uniref:hypothetical protein n=1 Tax=unclassified Paracoccus (in: a-proteobacteria) TaxID=2688777 RepID=UPI00236AD2A5|nr:hypothetical protein [Paracoccus sp. UBA5162]MDB2552308.1 hypothetical protein [Paracoccus sp. (in: a-proteobacteria)]|tara:strand:- start:16 stop:519 length:504 start_codon:yes stop_codon:yes gene_type:complete
MFRTLLTAGLVAGTTTLSLVSSAYAEKVTVEAVMVPQESIRMDFGDGTDQFVLMVRREGKSEGTGALAGASVSEFGWHDIDPPKGGDPQGYLQFTTENGDVANIKFTVRAVFMKDGDKPRLVDYGFWELVSGSGQFEGMTGVGTLTIKSVSETDRQFSLDGELGARP